MAIVKDIWRVGAFRGPVETLLTPDALRQQTVTWLDNPGPLQFLADPFAVERHGRLHLFVEAYDYRDRRGWIEALVLDDDLQIVERGPALREPWHLSYPFVVEEGEATYMLPEAHRSGGLWLYRAEVFPYRWTRVAQLALDQVAIDATPVQHEGLWWLFYTPATTRVAKVGELHCAYAETLVGPWRPHPGNPVRRDPASSRPGGRPFTHQGAVVLPVQDCRTTYGGAIRPLTITQLSPTRFEAEAGAAIKPPAGFEPYAAGLHSWSAAGDLVFIDAKRQLVTQQSLWLDVRREVGKLRRPRTS